VTSCHAAEKKIMMLCKLRSVALTAGTVLALMFDSSSASAFKIGYSGIPLVVKTSLPFTRR
jgi:hypothetical protein